MAEAKEKESKYGVTRLVAGSPYFMEIKKEEFDSGVALRSNLLELLYWEEKFDYVIGNYTEFEKALLEATAGYSVRGHVESLWMAEKRNLIDRRIANLLTTTKMYLDHSGHHFSKIYGKNSPLMAKIKGLKNSLYDEWVEYRIMEEIRNSVQHWGFSVHALSFPGTTVYREEVRKLEFSCIPYLVPKNFDEDKKFKHSVLEELNQLGEKVDLRPVIRKYVECLATVHEESRKLIKNDIDKWDADTHSLFNRYFEKSGQENKSDVLSFVVGASHVYSESHTIFKRSIERRKSFENKNFGLTNLAISYVTNESG